VFETSEFAVLHLSCAVLDKTSPKPTKVFARLAKEQEVCIALLSDKQEQATLDLYINCT